MTGIKSGTLNLKLSYKYRALEDYLISRERWEKHKLVLLERAGLLEFMDPKTVLDELDSMLAIFGVKPKAPLRGVAHIALGALIGPFFKL